MMRRELLEGFVMDQEKLIFEMMRARECSSFLAGMMTAVNVLAAPMKLSYPNEEMAANMILLKRAQQLHAMVAEYRPEVDFSKGNYIFNSLDKFEGVKYNDDRKGTLI